MKFLIIGDVVGEPGRKILLKYLEKHKENYDFIIVNGENSAEVLELQQGLQIRCFPVV